jgi:long-subunit acyl-CoA synthetase (AMP-forming)
VGEICIASPVNMLGYWNLPEATAKTLIDGYVHTGDAGYLDEDGYVYVHDRVKDMIVSAPRTSTRQRWRARCSVIRQSPTSP